MRFNHLKDLLQHQLIKLYSSEQQISQVLPLMAEMAYSKDLRRAFSSHISRTENQLIRLQKVLENLNISHNGEWCEGMEGLIKECKEIIHAEGEPEIRDSALITTAQRINLYEISCYSSVLMFSGELGFDNASEILEQSLDEEQQIEKDLTTLAKGGFFSPATGE